MVVTYLFKYKTAGIIFNQPSTCFKFTDTNVLLVYSLLRCIHLFVLYYLEFLGNGPARPKHVGG